jgi:hypothetical protein
MLQFFFSILLFQFYCSSLEATIVFIGECSSTMMCSCDRGFNGDVCEPEQLFPEYLKEGFPLVDGSNDIPESLQLLDSFVSRKYKDLNLHFHQSYIVYSRYS